MFPDHEHRTPLKLVRDALSTANHLATWAGLAPGNHASAGKQSSGKTRPGNRVLRSTLVQAAHALARTKTYLAAHTAAALAKRGYPILADDVAVLDDCGETFLVQPGYPRLRLWKPAVRQRYE